MLDLKWSPGEKKAAHAAFEAALRRERAAIRREVASRSTLTVWAPISTATAHTKP